MLGREEVIRRLRALRQPATLFAEVRGSSLPPPPPPPRVCGATLVSTRPLTPGTHACPDPNDPAVRSHKPPSLAPHVCVHTRWHAQCMQSDYDRMKRLKKAESELKVEDEDNVEAGKGNSLIELQRQAQAKSKKDKAAAEASKARQQPDAEPPQEVRKGDHATCMHARSANGVSRHVRLPARKACSTSDCAMCRMQGRVLMPSTLHGPGNDL